MNAFNLLKEDHKKVARLFDQTLSTSARAKKTREAFFQRLYQELDIHSRAEEQLLYPVLRESEETREMAIQAEEEHRIVKNLSNELNASEKDNEVWFAKLNVLKEIVEHHVEEEETEMFRKARKALTERQLNELGDRIAEAKKKIAKAASK